MVDEDKEFCEASGSTKQPTHAPGTKLVQSRVLDMPTDESEVDASEWHKLSGLTGRSFSKQVVSALHCAKGTILLQPDTLLPICIEEKVD